MSVLRRVWAAPLWAHILVLAIGLLALVPVVGTSSSFSPDEPVAITQARSLAEGGGWIVDHPFPQVDPEGRFYPLAGSSQGEQGMAPFAKHPVYPLMLAALEPFGGLAAMMIVSVLATAVAAALGALLAREIAGGLERPVLWAVGVASPLFFDAYLVIAHSLGAAFATAATLVVVIAIRRHRTILLMVAAMALMSAAVLMRSEALIFAVALGVGTAAAGVTSRRHVLVAGGALVAGAGVAAALFEKWLLHMFIGSEQAIGVPPAGGSFLEARWAGFLNTWLSPSSSSGVGGGDALLVIVMLLAVAGVAVLRWRSTRPYMLVVLAVTATVLTALGFFADPDRVVPGLLVAFPLAVFGIGLVDRGYFQSPERLVVTVTVGLFMAGVLATQYGAGGSAEWGGRYFALGLPLLTVLSIDALARRSPTLPAPVRRWAGAGVVTCSLLLAVGAATSLTSLHRHNHRLVGRLVSTSQQVVPGDGGMAVVVSAWPNIARHVWPTTPPQRWLYDSDEARGGELAARLIDAGITELTFIGQKPEEVAPYLEDYTIDAPRSYEDGRWKVSVLVARP